MWTTVRHKRLRHVSLQLTVAAALSVPIGSDEMIERRETFLFPPTYSLS